MINPLLSILVPTVPRRVGTYFHELVEALLSQTQDNPEVEIIGLFDNKRRSVGDKRNALLDITNGEYLAFIDDDDKVAPDYIARLLSAIKANPGADVICFDCITTINGDVSNQTYSKYSKDFAYTQTPSKVGGYIQWRGKPAHTMCWASRIAKKHRFPGKNYAEDVDWVVRATTDVKTEVQLGVVLYYYNFDKTVTETR